MAVWQWKIYIVSQNEILRCFSVIPEYIEEEWFYSISWELAPSIEEFEIFFDTLLDREIDPRAAKNVLSWGTNNQNEIGLVIEDNKIDCIGIQIDTGEIDSEFIQSIVNFAKKKELLFWEIELSKIIEPEISIFMKELEGSRANLFTKNPKSFFEDKIYLDKVNKENLRKLD